MKTMNALVLPALLQDGGLSPLAWLAIIVALVLLVWLFIWLLRNGWGEKPAIETRTRSSMAVEKPAAVEPVVVEPAKPIVEPLAAAPALEDNLIIIEGIGPKICSVLNAAGITTFAALAEMKPEQISEILLANGLRLANPASWPEQARLAANGDMVALKAMQDKLKGGISI